MVKKYYLDPILLNEGYNFVNTLTYAIVVVVATWLAFKFLEKMKIKIDRNFIFAILSLVFLGTLIRLFEEAGIFVSYLIVTPFIWIEMFAFALIIILISKFVEKKFRIQYYKTILSVCIALSTIPLLLLLAKITQFSGMAITLAILSPILLTLYLVKWKVENKLVTLAHSFDASATFTAVQFFGFSELHVVPRLLISNLSPLSFVIVKLVVVVGVLMLIDRYSDDKDFNNFLKLIIAILGIGPAVRDFYLLGIS